MSTNRAVFKIIQNYYKNYAFLNYINNYFNIVIFYLQVIHDSQRCKIIPDTSVGPFGGVDCHCHLAGSCDANMITGK